MQIDKIIFRYDEDDEIGNVEYYDRNYNHIDTHNFDDIPYDMFRSMYVLYLSVSMDIVVEFEVE